jgi:peptidylprolyl isomerase
MIHGSIDGGERSRTLFRSLWIAAALFVTLGLQACDSGVELIVGQLMVTDTIVGTGVAASATDSILVYYVLIRTDDDEICDLAIPNGGDDPPIGLRLGNGSLIKGFNDGMVGAREGGRREIIIPPNLGYGLDPPPRQNCIRENEFLQFTVDLIEVVAP